MLKIIILIVLIILNLPLILFLFTKDEKEEYQCEILEEMREKDLLEKGKEE